MSLFKLVNQYCGRDENQLEKFTHPPSKQNTGYATWCWSFVFYQSCWCVHGSVGDSTSTTTSLSFRQRFSHLLHRDSTLSSTVFNASDSVNSPTTPGGTYRSSVGDDEAAATALMSVGDNHSRQAQRSASARRSRPRPPVDVSSDLIDMDSFR